MTTATQDLDAVEREIVDRVVELTQRRASLALDALSDREAAKELADVEQRLAAAEAEGTRLDLARVEQARREVQARQGGGSASRGSVGSGA